MDAMSVGGRKITAATENNFMMAFCWDVDQTQVRIEQKLNLRRKIRRHDPAEIECRA
jgi:hypothetical protein